MNKILSRINDIIRNPDIIFPENRKFKNLILIFLISYIFIWQGSIALSDLPEDRFRKYGILHSCGASFSDPEHVFTYGIYYWGLFPVFPMRAILPQEFADDKLYYSKEGARRIIKDYGYSLGMDIDGTFRMGNVFNLWLPYLTAVAKGTVKDVNFIPFNAFFFMLALCVLLLSLWYNNRGILGIFLVLLIGSYPFQIYSVYLQDNIFSYMISTLIIMAGICMPFILDAGISARKQLALVVTAGLWGGIAYLMRADCMTAILAAAAAVLFYRHASIPRKVFMLVLLAVSFMAATGTIHKFAEYKFYETKKIVQEKGGSVFTGLRLKNHLFWHTIWCGMYDFDKKYGHDWGDYYAEVRAREILNAKYGENIPPIQYHNRPIDGYLPAVTENYDKAMRDLVFRDIKHDPAWYFGLLFKRLHRILFESIQPQIRFLTGYVIYLPDTVFLYIILFIYLCLARVWAMAKLVLFMSVSMTVPFFVTTFTNYHHYSISHLAMAGVFWYCFLKILVNFIQDVNRKRSVRQGADEESHPDRF